MEVRKVGKVFTLKINKVKRIFRLFEIHHILFLFRQKNQSIITVIVFSFIIEKCFLLLLHFLTDFIRLLVTGEFQMTFRILSLLLVS